MTASFGPGGSGWAPLTGDWDGSSIEARVSGKGAGPIFGG